MHNLVRRIPAREDRSDFNRLTPQAMRWIPGATVYVTLSRTPSPAAREEGQIPSPLQADLKTDGVGCRPNDIDICLSATGASGSSCNSSANRAVSSNTVAFIVFSTGKDGATASAYGADELANVDGNQVFVSRTPSGPDSTAGTYDDLMVWVPAGVLYSKLISAGVLP